jgi:Carboxypeptidase regulatory-like domain
MPRHSHLVAAAFLVAGLSSPLAAQGTTVLVRGVAYDSVRGAPLAGAVITMAGDARTVRADSRGRFEFDGVAPGVHTFSAQHAALDSLGFSGISARTTVTDGRTDVRIAGPSFSTLWQSVCGTKRVPKDSGFVYGTVRDAITQTPVPNATVDLTWLDLSVDRAKHISQSRYRGQTRSDNGGNYYICGVPRETGTRIRAMTDSATSGLIDLLGTGNRVRRRDLTIGTVSDSGATKFGVISGQVADSSGRPIADARVIADGAPELRSGSDGRFIVKAVPVGTRQVEVLAIGMSPVITVVDVSQVDTASILATMRKITTLDVVRVTASPIMRRLARELDERRSAGFGHIRDSTEIANHGSLFSVMYEFPSVQVERKNAAGDFVVTMPGTGAARCLANVIIDGQMADFDQLNFLRPADIALLEVYPHRMSMPVQFVRSNDCGVIVVWTKWHLG